MSNAFVYPNGSKTPPRVSGNFGPRTPFWTPGGWTSNFHYGTDFAYTFSTVRSPVDGVVVYAGFNTRGLGNLVIVRDEYGDEWWHAHLAPGSFRVSYGSRVSAGSPVGTMGTTGKSTGIHLHWEFHPKGGAAKDAMVEARRRLAILAAEDSKPFDPPKPQPQPKKRKKKDMTTFVIHTNDAADKDRSGAIVDLAAGVFSPFGWFPVSYANGLAVANGAEKSAEVTRGHYQGIQRDCAAQATRLGKVFVDIADEDVPKIGG